MKKLFKGVLFVLLTFIFSVGVAKAQELYDAETSLDIDRVVKVGDSFSYELSLVGNVGAIVYDPAVLSVDKENIGIGYKDGVQSSFGYLDSSSYELDISTDGIIYFNYDSTQKESIIVTFNVIGEGNGFSTISHTFNNIGGGDAMIYDLDNPIEEIKNEFGEYNPVFISDSFYVVDEDGNCDFSKNVQLYELSADEEKAVALKIEELTKKGTPKRDDITDDVIDDIISDADTCKCISDSNILSDPLFIGVSCGAVFFCIISIILIIRNKKSKKETI